MIKISVITPTYNREKYVKNAIEYLKTQTLEGIEFIIIDDGSVDNTLKELKKATGTDKRFKIIGYKGNKGPSYARNQGLEVSQGEYIGFFDIDDTIPEDYYEILYKTAKENNADISIATSGTQPKNLEERLNLLRKGSVWDKIYKKEFLIKNKISFLEGYFTADTLFTIQAIYQATSLNITEKTKYDYKLQMDSIGFDNKHIQKRKRDIFIVLKHINDFIENKNLSLDEKKAFQSFVERCFSGYQNDKTFQKQLYKEIGLKQKKNKEKNMFLLRLAKNLHIINSKKYKELRAIDLFKSSELFNAEWYLKTYPDVKESNTMPEKHYYKYGWKEGRNPSPLFNNNAYLKEYYDVRDTGRNPLEHYLISGQYEGRYYTSIDNKTSNSSNVNISSLPRKKTKFWDKIKYALEYPIRVQEEYERLKAEIKELEKTSK